MILVVFTISTVKLGDLVVLGQGAFLESPEVLGQIEVPATVVGGQIMHQTDAVGID